MYPAELLGRNEEITMELRPHWRALFFPIIFTVLFLVAGIFLYSWVGNLFENAVPARWVILIGFLIAAFIWSVKPIIVWLSTEYVFTTERVITRSGIIAKKGIDIPVSKVVNVSFKISILGRMLNYGDIKIESAGEGDDSDVYIHSVPNPQAVQREVYKLHDEDDARRRRRAYDSMRDKDN